MLGINNKNICKFHIKILNLYLGTVDKLHAAHRFYEKYGFSRISEKELSADFHKCPLDTLFFKITSNELRERIYDE